MSVRTTADERIDAAAEHVKGAIDALSDVAVSHCWGWSDFTPEWQERHMKALLLLIEVRSNLAR